MKKTKYMQDQKTKLTSFINSKEYNAMTPEDMIFLLVVPPEDADTFQRILQEIIEEGGAFVTRKGRVITPAMADLVSGTFEHKAQGFGFVLGEGEDVFVPKTGVKNALHGDKVLCRITEKGDPSSVGEIVKILSRSKKFVVGTLNDGYVIPDDRRFPKIFIDNLRESRAKDGQKVVAETSQNFGEKEHTGKITEILGNAHDIGMDVLSIVLGHEIPHEFPNNVLKAADGLPETVLATDFAGRRDFRGFPTVTIDGSDTKDIDDAVSLEALDDGLFRLYVHIADVGHYVTVGSALWKEALKRGTSVYLADRVIPMLPQKLSNGICSLNPRVDRLALSCVMDINANGVVVAHEICESVIHSDHAVTYDALADMLENPDSPHKAQYTDFLQMFENMASLAKILRERRLRQGAMEFDFPEAKIIVDAKGRVVDIVRRHRSMATSIIEEFMVAANEAVSTEYHWLDMPFIYRVHEEPDREKIEALMTFIANFGYSLKGSVARTKSLQTLLAHIENTPEALLISKQVLRSMKQARYAPVALGHFGLAKQFYSHFTSPIRRFPDLAIHSIIKANIAGKTQAKKFADFMANLEQICISCSENERRADIAQRDVEDLKKVEYMQDKVGKAYDGIISHVTARGFYVELPNTVEGFVTVDSLGDDYYIFHEEHSTLMGERLKKAYRIGDAARIIVAKADMEMRRLDFVLA
ncbi:MAG: ribonuclease R [Defluviitaleaceae bacterium]|nr:ribonuclease R [Defluviitaleaceae bacterium]